MDVEAAPMFASCTLLVVVEEGQVRLGSEELFVIALITAISRVDVFGFCYLISLSREISGRRGRSGSC